jgi:putative membrane protein
MGSSNGDAGHGTVGIYLRGVAMGLADAVPGVSGGTIALIVGVYERLITAITALDVRALHHLRRAHTRDGRRSLVSALVGMDVPFLLVLGGGVLSSLVLVSGAMHVAATEHPVPTYSFFFGLIAASAVVLRGAVGVEPRCLAAGVGGFLLAFLVAGASAGGLPHTAPALFGSGAVAIAAMVLPGVSGSFVLLLLGQYEFMTGLPGRLAAGLGAALGGNVDALVGPVAALTAFGGGAAVGLFSFAHLVRYALTADRRATLTFLVALMFGALRAPATEVVRAVDAWTVGVALTTALAAGVGAAVVLVLDRIAGVGGELV